MLQESNEGRSQKVKGASFVYAIDRVEENNTLYTKKWVVAYS